MYVITATKYHETHTLCICRTKRQGNRAIKKFQSRKRDKAPEVFKMEKIHKFTTLNFVELVYKIVRHFNRKRYLRMIRRRDRLNRRIKNYTLIK